MIEWLQQIEYWQWLSLGLLLLILEMFVPGAIFLWCGTSALIVGLLHLFIPDMMWQWQWVIFSVLSVVSFFVWRHYFRGTHPEENNQLNQRSKALIGRRATLVEAIENGFGRIQLDDTFWRVEGEDLPLGAAIEIVDVDGATLKVKKIDN